MPRQDVHHRSQDCEGPSDAELAINGGGSLFGGRKKILPDPTPRWRRSARVSLSRVFTGLAPVVLLASMAAPEVALAAPPSAPPVESDGDSGDAESVERDDRAATSNASSNGSAGSSAPSAPDAGGRKRVTLDDEFLVEGKLEKPNAFYVLRRSTLGYDWARLDARFSPLVLESVQDPLF